MVWYLPLPGKFTDDWNFDSNIVFHFQIYVFALLNLPFQDLFLEQKMLLCYLLKSYLQPPTNSLKNYFQKITVLLFDT